MAMRSHEINQRAAEEIVETAAEMREEFIRDVFDLVTGALEEQDASFDALAVEGYPEGKIVEYLVLEDWISLPFIDEEPQHALTVLLQSGSGVGEPDALRLFMPVDNELAVDEHLDFSLMQHPQYVVAERRMTSGVSAWYVIRPDGIVPYVPASESGEQTMADSFEDDDITDELIARQLSLQVDTAISTIVKLREDFVNYKLAVQRYNVIGNEEITDI